MPENTQIAPIIAMPTIRNVIGQTKPEDTARILEQNWEDIPSEDYTDTEKLAFVIAAIPFAGCYPASTLHDMLISNNKAAPADRNSITTRPAMYTRLEKYAPEVLARLTEAFRARKRAPSGLLENDNWVGLVALKEMLRHMTESKRIQDSPTIVKSIQADMEIEAACRLKETLKSDKNLAACCEAFVILLT